MITLEQSENNKIDNCISCDNRLHEISLVVGNQKIRLCNECLKEFILNTDVYKNLRREIIDNYNFKFEITRDEQVEKLKQESIDLRKLILYLNGKENGKRQLEDNGYTVPIKLNWETGEEEESYEGE